MRDFIRRRLGLVVVAAVILLLMSANRVATFLTELWWYEEVRARGVYVGILLTRITLGLAFGLFLAALVAVNLQVARRIRPLVLPATPQEAIVERYRQMADPYLPWLIAGIAALFALAAGGAVSAQWEPYLLWRNAQSFGVADPQFGKDVGFYVFQLPWLTFVQSWLFTALLLTGLVTAGAHYLLGGIRPEFSGEKVTPQVKVHLSILLAGIVAVRGWGYWLDRYHLNFSPRGQVTGASYTDVHAELPARHLLVVVSVVAVVLVLYNIRQRGWLLPGAAIGLLVLASLALSGAYPALIQRLRVDPQELEREAEYIGYNLESTNRAYAIDNVELTRFNVLNDLSADDVENHAVTLSNVRVWDPAVLNATYRQLQAIRPYYDFSDVDVDRYRIDGELRQVMLAARELDVERGLEAGAQTWQNVRLTYTHGNGLVLSQVNTATQEGQPVFLARDIPPRGADELIPDEPAIYYGEMSPTYSIVRTTQPELHYEDSDTGEPVYRSYTGRGGVPLGGMGRRIAYALRFGDPNFVLSGLIGEDSKVLYHRNVAERVKRVAPFLHLDRDPYPVVLNGRILWVQDAYTTTSFYPYSERVGTATMGSLNYIRNSVKAVVDAYDGDVTLYVVDPDDPIVRAWRQALGGPFASIERLPEGLDNHFRYPQDIFQIQSEIYRTYHIPTVPAFYSKADAWDMPLDAARIANEEVPASTRLEPYYLLMRLPGQETEEFVLIQPYLARARPVMIAWLAGRSDPGVYGQLYGVQFPGDQTILGPSQVQARIDQDATVAEYKTLRSQAGARVRRGDLLVIPIEQSILYVQPIFLRSPQAEIPELNQVVIVLGERVVMAPTLAQALERLLGAAVPGFEDEDPDVTVDTLIVRALEWFREAERALRAGDLAGYQRALAEAQRLIEQAAEILGIPVEELEEEIANGEPPDEAPPDDGDGGGGDAASPDRSQPT